MENINKELKTLYEQKKELEQKIEFLENKKQRSIKSYILLSDAIYIDISHLSKKLIDLLEQLATFENPQIKTLQLLRKPIYNTPRYIKNFEYDNKTLRLPRGLMRAVITLLQRYNLDTTYRDKRYYQSVEFPKVTYNLREEQQKAIEQIGKKDFSLCIAPPGFGKTLIGAKMIEIRKCNTLVIVNKNMLLDQWIERFVNYFGYTKKEIGYLGKGKNRLNTLIDVATMQSLKNNLDSIKNYSFVIVDECHHIPALTFEKIIKQFCGKYILGLSATPNRKDGMEPLIYQQLGSIAYEVKSKRLVTNKLKIVETDFSSNEDTVTDIIKQIMED